MVRRKKPIVVHLGGVGYGEKALEKSRRYARRFPGINFKAVDVKPYPGEKPGNLETVEADFRKGLEREKDSSVDLISSEMALGFYGARYRDYNEHALETFKAAHRKLRKGGKLMFVVDSLMADRMKKDLVEAGFAGENVSARRVSAKERQRTFWMREWKGFLYQVVAVK
jgi:hypothetical protein